MDWIEGKKQQLTDVRVGVLKKGTGKGGSALYIVLG